ncbi:MAG: hypothetical protein R2880_21885 [Deinococcales bacterium]
MMWWDMTVYPITDDIYTFNSDAEAEAVLAWILDYTGYRKNFHHSSGECVECSGCDS